MRVLPALLLAALLAAATPGCLEAATRDELPPATDQCRTLADGARQPLILIQVRRIDTDSGRDLGPVAGIQVNVTKGEGRQMVVIGNHTTDERGCVGYRLQGPGVYRAEAAQGEGVCRARGLISAGTDAERHVELRMRLQDPCASRAR